MATNLSSSEIIVRLRETYEGETWESCRSFDNEIDLDEYVADKEGIGASVEILGLSAIGAA